MPTVTVLSREHCHLCEVAVEQVQRICQELGAEWTVSDVDSDPELRAEYGEMVPVILVDGEQHGYWHVDESRLRRALERR